MTNASQLQKLTGQCVVMTGKGPMPRNMLQDLVRDAGSVAGYAAEAEGIEWAVRPVETPDGTRWRGEARDMATGQVGDVGRSDFWTAEQCMMQCALDAGVGFWRPDDSVQFQGDWIGRYAMDNEKCAVDMREDGWARADVAAWCRAVGAAEVQMLRFYDGAAGLTSRRGNAHLFLSRSTAERAATALDGVAEFQLDGRAYAVRKGRFYAKESPLDAR